MNILGDVVNSAVWMDAGRGHSPRDVVTFAELVLVC